MHSINLFVGWLSPDSFCPDVLSQYIQIEIEAMQLYLQLKVLHVRQSNALKNTTKSQIKSTETEYNEIRKNKTIQNQVHCTHSAVIRWNNTQNKCNNLHNPPRLRQDFSSCRRGYELESHLYRIHSSAADQQLLHVPLYLVSNYITVISRKPGKQNELTAFYFLVETHTLIRCFCCCATSDQMLTFTV